jgi:hypothetical protein
VSCVSFWTIVHVVAGIRLNTDIGSLSGFEYWANPKARDEGFITWYSDNKPSARMGASAMGPDSGVNSTGVSQRIVPEEPMVRFFARPSSRARTNVSFL